MSFIHCEICENPKACKAGTTYCDLTGESHNPVKQVWQTHPGQEIKNILAGAELSSRINALLGTAVNQSWALAHVSYDSNIGDDHNHLVIILRGTSK